MQELSREEALKRVDAFPGDKRNQGAIVNLMSAVGTIRKVVHQIPGGAKLTETEDAETLPAAVFNWIRRGGDFERFEVSLVGDYEIIEDLQEKGIKTRKKLLMDFNHKPGIPPYWKRKGFKHVAALIAKALLESENPVSIIVEKEGIFVIVDGAQVFTPESELWNPTLIIHQIRR